MTAYYNEIDPFAAQWLRNLIAAGLIAPGVVDTRSIEDVTPNDLIGFTQCHFFAGIGGWSVALRMAGWPDTRRVWTGSCPCQPFSTAGKGAGFADERHLWPSWLHLIGQRMPVVLFGEQVAAAIKAGWLDLVSSDLEGYAYRIGAARLAAPSIGAPHKRERVWFVADATNADRRGGISGTETGTRADQFGRFGFSGCGADDPDTLAVAVGQGSHAGAYGRIHSIETGARSWDGEPQRYCDVDRLGEPYVDGREPGRAIPVGDAIGSGLEVVSEQQARGERAAIERESLYDESRPVGDSECDRYGRSGRSATNVINESSYGALYERDPWQGVEWVYCRDGKYRPVKPGILPLADGISGRVGTLKASGNAIVPQLAAEFIKAYMSITT